jgi:hypothetical protein
MGRTKTKAELQEYLTENFADRLAKLRPEQRAAVRRLINSDAYEHNKQVRRLIRQKTEERKEADDLGIPTDAEIASGKVQRDLQAESKAAAESSVKWIADTEKVIEMSGRVAVPIAALGGIEFLADTTHGRKVIAKAGKIRAKAAKLEEECGHVRELAERVRATTATSDHTKAWLDLDALVKGCRQLGTHHYALGDYAIDAIDDAKKAVDFELLKSHVKDNPDKVVKILEAVSSISDTLIDIGAEAAGPYKPLVVASTALKALATRQLMAFVATMQVRKLRKGAVAGKGLTMLEGDPLLPAKRVAQKQIANFDQALAMVGAVAGNLEPWPFIKAGLQVAGHAYFNARVDKLHDDLVAKAKLVDGDDESAAEQIMKEIFAGEKEAMISTLTSALLKASIDPKATVTAIFQPALEWAVTQVVKRMPISPSQEVSADGLRSSFEAMKAAARLERAAHHPEHIEELDHQELKPPKYSKDKHHVHLLQTGIEHDDDGPYWWAKVHGKVGTVRKDGTFTADPEAPRFPDKYGTHPVKIMGTLESRPDHVLAVVADLLGALARDESEFIAQQPAVFADWSDRVVEVGGYKKKGDAALVAGTWTSCTNADTGNSYYRFVPASGGAAAREWARRDSKTGNGETMATVFEHTKLPKGEVALPA